MRYHIGLLYFYMTSFMTPVISTLANSNQPSVGSISQLMRLAFALGKAKQTGDFELISRAQSEHRSYQEICLKSNDLTISMLDGKSMVSSVPKRKRRF